MALYFPETNRVYLSTDNHKTVKIHLNNISQLYIIKQLYNYYNLPLCSVILDNRIFNIFPAYHIIHAFFKFQFIHCYLYIVSKILSSINI